VKLQIRTHSIRINAILLLEDIASSGNTPIELSFLSTPTPTVTVTAGSAAFAAVPLCREPGSRRSVQNIAVSIIFLLAIFKDGDGNIFLRFTGRRHIYQRRHLHVEILGITQASKE
jgi:hypothetical protein